MMIYKFYRKIPLPYRHEVVKSLLANREPTPKPVSIKTVLDICVQCMNTVQKEYCREKILISCTLCIIPLGYSIVDLFNTVI